MATVFNLTALEVPAVQYAAALDSLKAAYDSSVGTSIVSQNLVHNDLPLIKNKFNRNAKGLDLAFSFGGSPVYNVSIGLDVTATATLATITPGQANIGGIVELSAAGTIALVTGTNYLWLLQDGSLAAQVNTLTAPAALAAVYLGCVQVDIGDTGAQDVDRSGVFFNRTSPWRKTADATTPSDTPPAAVGFQHRSTNGLYQWDGISYTKVGDGLPGSNGVAASIFVGSVSQSAPGTPPTVNNSGSPYAAILDFTFPPIPDTTVPSDLTVAGFDTDAAPLSVSPVSKLSFAGDGVFLSVDTDGQPVANIPGDGTGTPGADGAPGSRIYSGSGAPSGGLGINGDYYINTNATTGTGDLYTKAGGAWTLTGNIRGPQGATGTAGTAGTNGSNGTNGTNGSNGTNGAAGSQIYNGSGVPSSGLGVNGDYYINTTTGSGKGDVYFRASGAWSVVLNIVGPAGTGGGSIPAGSTNQTLRYSATNTLSATSFLTNTDAEVTINPGGDTGTGQGLTRLHVHGQAAAFPGDVVAMFGDDIVGGSLITAPSGFFQGAVTMVKIGNNQTGGDAALLLTNNGYAGLMISDMNSAGTSAHFNIGGANDASKPLILQRYGGKVGIGFINSDATPRLPTEQLEVYGNVLADGYKVYDSGTPTDGFTGDIPPGSTIHVVGGIITGFS